jgi:hypothetical protein
MAAFDRDQLLAALNEIGAAAVAAHTRLDIAMFGGSALMLASNFRFATEDVDIAEIGRPWLLAVLEITDADGAIAALTEFFPNSASDMDKVQFVLSHIFASQGAPDAPRYPGRDL